VLAPRFLHFCWLTAVLAPPLQCYACGGLVPALVCNAWAGAVFCRRMPCQWLFAIRLADA